MTIAKIRDPEQQRIKSAEKQFIPNLTFHTKFNGRRLLKLNTRLNRQNVVESTSDDSAKLIEKFSSGYSHLKHVMCIVPSVKFCKHETKVCHVMANVYKYLTLLESLKFPSKNENHEQFTKENFEILQKYVKLSVEELRTELQLNEVSLSFQLNGNEVNEWTYGCYLLHVLQTLKTNINLDNGIKEELISVRQMNSLKSAIESFCYFSIVKHLDPEFHKYPPFHIHGKTGCSSQCAHLKFALKLMFELVNGTHIPLQMKAIIIQFMAGLFMHLSCQPSDKESYENMLNYLWEHIPKEEYFQNLLFMKGVKSQMPVQSILHKELLKRLAEPGGFVALVKNILKGNEDENFPKWKRYEIIYKIVAHKGHTRKFHHAMIKQIFEFIKSNFLLNDNVYYVEAGVATLHEIAKLKEDLMEMVQKQIDSEFSQFISPPELLTGFVVMDNIQFKTFTNLMYYYFCNSTHAFLPSKMIVKFLPVLICLTKQIPEVTTECCQIKTLVAHCLANRETGELSSILQTIILRKNIIHMVYMHSRIAITYCDKTNAFQVQIGSEENACEDGIAISFAKILKSSQRNILICNVFVELLGLLETANQISTSTSQNNLDFIEEEDLDSIVEIRFKKRISLISVITEVATYRPLYIQLREHSSEVFQILNKMIQNRFAKGTADTENDECLSIFLAVLQEVLENLTERPNAVDIHKSLNSYLKHTNNEVIRRQISTIIELLEGGGPRIQIDASKYQLTRSLLNETEPHLRVYGIRQLVSLLNERDDETIANKYAILASALVVLRDGESFVYHNCIRLLVKLADFLEAEVLEALASEYLNDSETVEYRLKVGDAILHIAEDLGQLLYKYKDTLANCFLHGCKNENNDVRASSFSNLGNLCKQLQFQVHNFFYELLNIVESNMKMEQYLPARRASVMVLSQILQGIGNLMDFEEFLLPTYRLLNYVVDNDPDQVCRVQATNGIKVLNQKCNEFLTPKLSMQKEIKIMGIKDNTVKKKGSILELN